MHDLQRFVEAQENMYSVALQEIKESYKRSHWMWFIFPQLFGIGDSDKAHKYGIANIEEARSYMQHSILGPRLLEVSKTVLSLSPDICPAFLGWLDGLKLRSCMTLFAEACPEYEIFQEVLDKFFEGEKDQLTLKLLSGKKNIVLYNNYAITGWPCYYFTVDARDKYNMKIEKYCQALKEGAKDLSWFQKVRLFFFRRYLTVFDNILYMCCRR